MALTMQVAPLVTLIAPERGPVIVVVHATRWTNGPVLPRKLPSPP